MSDTSETVIRALVAAERGMQGTLGASARSLSDPSLPVVTYQAEQAFPAASTIKVYVLQTLLEHAARGALDLAEERVLRSDDQVTGSGVLKSLSAGRRYTLLDLATLMVIVSDNTATNLLIERLGVDSINASIGEHGWQATHLAGLLQRPRPAGHSATSRSTTSPSDLADYFTRLWQGTLLPAELTALAQGIYRRQQRTDQLGRYLPFDPDSTEDGTDDLVIASKSGSIRGVRNDAGVIETGATRYVLAIMTRGCPDARFHPDNLGSLAVSEASKTLFQHFTGAS